MRGKTSSRDHVHFQRGTLASRPKRHQSFTAAGAPPQPLSVPLVVGPYQNNGATIWFANVDIGQPGQPLKIALDTGSNFIWTTSSLCPSGCCTHYGNGSFNYANSSSFSWINQTPILVDFGPWGSMVVETGQDNFAITSNVSLQLDAFLASMYCGEQFAELDWDGGLGIPSGSDYVDPGVSFFVEELMNNGAIDPSYPYISFSMDPSRGVGSVLFGAIDQSAVDPLSAIYLPWTPYTAFPDVEYIWTTPLNSYQVGTRVVATNALFCLDSGSSQFKGDTNIMNTTLQVLGPNPTADVSLLLGAMPDGQPGTIVVPPSIYMVEIQEGPGKGETLPQFNPLGLNNLVLVGSVLMQNIYTTYVYDVTETTEGYHLAPVGMVIFNKIDGPRLIQSTNNTPWTLQPRPVHKI
jgi:hypothetical protein